MATHAMIDVETLGVGTMPVLLSIGAVRFRPEDDAVEEPLLLEDEWKVQRFFRAIDPASCVAVGGTLDAGALTFWSAPEQLEARKHAFGHPNPVSIHQAVHDLAGWLSLDEQRRTMSEWVEEWKADHAWSHGAGFDLAILKRYAEKFSIKWPIGYRCERDTRTLFDLVERRGMKLDEPGSTLMIPHHPTWDAWRQACLVQDAYQLLGGVAPCS